MARVGQDSEARWSERDRERGWHATSGEAAGGRPADDRGRRRLQGAGLIAGENFDPVPGYDDVLAPCPPLDVTERDVDFTVQVPEESPSEGANTGRP